MQINKVKKAGDLAKKAGGTFVFNASRLVRKLLIIKKKRLPSRASAKLKNSVFSSVLQKRVLSLALAHEYVN